MNTQEESIRIVSKKGYFVDSLGNVFNKNKRPIKLSKSNSGYLSFNTRISCGRVTRVFVHRLQAFQKFGDCIFNKGIHVRHLNGIPIDNSFENIDIGSQSDNMMDIPKEKRIVNASNPKFNHEVIIKEYKNGMTYLEIMKKHNIKSKGTVSFIINKSLKSEIINKHENERPI